MVILKDISVIWSLLHTLVMFLILFESRYPKKKTLIITLSAMLPFIAVNFILFIIWGTDHYLNVMLISLSLPSLIFFWFLAKNRDGRFFFTFCMVDTIVLEIICITNIIDHYIPGETYIFMFVTRLLAYPLIEWVIYKKFRYVYHEVQRKTKKSWWVFACIGVLFYVAMELSMGYPTIITSRPEYLPVLFILFLLMPLSYINIFNTILHQQKIHSAAEKEHILTLQVENMKERMEALADADERFRVERHDFRHKMQIISNMAENGELDKLRAYLDDYNEIIEKTHVKRYCQNVIIDAVLSSYLQRAEKKGIRVNVKIAFPDVLPADDAELATVFANAVENSVNACEKIEKDKRYIDIKAINTPRFMIQISNSYDGKAKFDSHNIPIAEEDGHGLGTHSIIAFCEKHGAFYEFKADYEKFVLQIVF